MANETTPMMKQFYELKEKHPDALILFRCGDFYETYADDAKTASEILGITLTRRSNGRGPDESQNTAMAGFPHHALDTYLPKLIRAGKRVAICDQLEDPKLTKKLVKRGITEVVTPGVILGDNVLNNKENNFLAAVHFGKATCGLSLLDISTGEYYVTEGTFDHVDKLITNFAPKEILVERGKKDSRLLNLSSKPYIYEMDDWIFAEDTAVKKLTDHFATKNLKGFGIEHLKCGIVAAGAILFYLEQTQHTQIKHIHTISRIDQTNYVRMDYFTIRSLELVDSINEGGRSLLSVIDKTISPMGGRLLRRWTVFPLKDVDKIKQRQKVVEYFFRDTHFSETVDEQLYKIGDLERLASKIAVGRISPRDLVQLKVSLMALEPIKQLCDASEDENIRKIGKDLDSCQELYTRIEREIVPDPPFQLNRGQVIAQNVNAELDELRDIAYNGKDYLIKIQQRECEQTGIQSLKIGFNNVFGYYMEVRNTFKDKVPQEWIRKQTLVNAERYITQELKEYEDKILGAEEKISVIESRIFTELVMFASDYITKIQNDANLIAKLDCLFSFAKAAKEYKYVCPEVDESNVTDIRQGRHPVIERQMPAGEQYVANDVYLDDETQQIIVLTGPNMAGKSALLRQTALITLMAQMGSYVPADSARIGYVDKIFTRVGASDNISLGESTFMVEMNEASNILNNISPRSLVLFDELGRGTSTYDGISIAWAIIEHIHENANNHPRTLFATHYHELNEMEKLFKRVKNYNVSVRESEGKVIFMRKLVPGGSEHSFGIHVAKIAGMLPSVVKRAEQVLKQLENANRQSSSGEKNGKDSHTTVSRPDTQAIASSGVQQLSFFQLDDPVLCQIRDEILELDINSLTPLDALNKLNEIKRIVKGKR